MAETIEADDASWSEIRVTTIFTAASATLFLTIFEIARRHPAVTAVFDRRRRTKPERTPPPLLRNSIMEWLFLSNERRYVDYADLASLRDVIMERRRQKRRCEMMKQKERKQLKNGTGAGNNDDDDDDDDDSQQHHSLDLNDLDDSSDDESGRSFRPNRGGTSSNRRNNNNNNRRNSPKSTSRTKITRYLTPDVVEVNGRRLPADIAEYALAGDLTDRQLDEYEQTLRDHERDEEMVFFQSRKAYILSNRLYTSATVVTKKKSNDGQSSAGTTTGNQSQTGSGVGDIEDQFSDAGVNTLNDDEVIGDNNAKLTLPSRPSRFRYFNFQQGGKGGNNNNTSQSNSPIATSSSAGTTDSTSTNSPTRPRSPHYRRGLFHRAISSKFFSSSRNNTASQHQLTSTRSMSPTNDLQTNHHLNRHLKTTSIFDKRPLTDSDREILSCIGLDTFVMIRFLRFCFDVTFYPFLLACLCLIPTYYTNDYDGVEEKEDGLTILVQTGGYFAFTINRLEPKSDRLWVAWGYGFFFFVFILRRLWIEWETFITLRFEFLANGDAGFDIKEDEKDYKQKSRVVSKKDDVRLHLEQYRNSCIVEYIPESHRRDQELFQFFDALFPDQIKRAEILINSSELNDLIQQRQRAIEKYETIYAKHAYAKQMYNQKLEGIKMDKGCHYYICCKCFCSGRRKPEDPRMSIGKSSMMCCGKKTVKALPHLWDQIKRLNREIETEHNKLMIEKEKVEDKDIRHGLLTDQFAKVKTQLIGVGEELTCSTGFVEFKTLACKQGALQCNLTGTNDHMLPTPAPDPRDILWENATVERNTITVKNLQFGGLLFTGTLFWSGVVAAVTSISDLDMLGRFLPSWLIPDEDTFWYDLVQGYLPVLLLELLMLLVPIILRIIAKNLIRFKTHSEVDSFIFKWHFGYRVANLVIIIVKSQLVKTFDLLRKNPQSAIDSLVQGIALSSQFFLNNMIVSTGTEMFFELAQIPTMVYHFILHQIITIGATSKRKLEKLQEPHSLEWGETIPQFIFALLVGIVYSTIVPFVTGVSALFFYIATKVYTHQALFVYSQPYEGGGLLMYQLTGSVFVIIYISIVIFSVLFTLKNGNVTGSAFLILMMIITVLVQKSINTTFIKPSTTLAMTNARIIDEDTERRRELARQWQEYKAAKRERRRRESQAALSSKKPSRDDSLKLGGGKPPISKDAGAKSGSYVPSSLLHVQTTSSESTTLTREAGNSNWERGHTSSLKSRGSKSKTERVRFLDPKNSSRARESVSSIQTSDSNDSKEEDDFYLYRQPQLNKAQWETKPRDYL